MNFRDHVLLHLLFPEVKVPAIELLRLISEESDVDLMSVIIHIHVVLSRVDVD